MTSDQPEAMECCPSKIEDINIRNVAITFDRVSDEWLDKRFEAGGEPIIIKHNINFVHCNFPDLFWYLLGNIHFKGYLTFSNCNQLKAKFNNCTFDKAVWVLGNEVEFIEFLNSDFKNGFKMERTLVTDKLRFDNCTFNLNPESFDDFGNALGTKPHLFYLQYRLDPPMNLIIEHCKFDLPESLMKLSDRDQVQSGYAVDINFSNFSNLRFNYNLLNTNVVFNRSSVTNHFSTHDCKFNRFIFTEHFSINSANSIVQWSTVENDKIAIFSEDSGEIVHKSKVENLYDELNFKSLVSSYAIFYASFRLQGDRISANRCYTEWKDIETSYLRNLKEHDGSVDTYFLYLMNVFLDFFCNYGTSPTKAINLSMFAMFLFSCFYFLFPSPGSSKESFWNRIRKYIYYFTHKKGLEESFLEQELNTLKDRNYAEFVEEIREHKKKLPFYFRLFGKQVYHVDQLKRKISRVIYRLFDRATGTWEELNKNRKIISGILYAFIISSMLIYFLSIRVLDAITLSINAFSTLGFGDIPVKGIVRYLTILEGFIGWFLLSIFSVSLISQILW